MPPRGEVGENATRGFGVAIGSFFGEEESEINFFKQIGHESANLVVTSSLDIMGRTHNFRCGILPDKTMVVW